MLYPDLGFILATIVRPEKELRQAVDYVLRAAPHPLQLSVVHRLQVENALWRSLKSGDADRIAAAKGAFGLWRQYLTEEVFVISKFDLESAFLQAIDWNGRVDGAPDKWFSMLHPAIAVTSNASLISVDPDVRKVAAKFRVKLHPRTL